MGFIKLDRQLMEHWLWEDKPFSRAQAWIDLIYLANHETKDFVQGGTLINGKRGNVYRSKTWLAERWGWSRKKVTSFLNLLEKEKMVLVNGIRLGTVNGTVITIVNYGKFQDVRTMKGTVKGTVKEPSRNREGTVKEHIQEPIRTYKEPIRNNMPTAGPEEDVLTNEDLYGVDPVEQYRRFLAGELNLDEE